jgi:hypothetical protein
MLTLLALKIPNSVFKGGPAFNSIFDYIAKVVLTHINVI